MNIFEEVMTLENTSSAATADLSIDREYNISSIVSKPKDPCRILTLPEDKHTKTERVEIRLAFSDLLSEQVDFIKTSIFFISEMLDCIIHVNPEVVEDSTHILVNSNSKGLCRRTYKYISGLLSKKAIVSFMWYIDLFEASKRISITDYAFTSAKLFIEKITRHHIIRGDDCYGDSNAPIIAHRSNTRTPLLKGVEIFDANKVLSEVEKALIKKFGGKVKSNKPTKKSKTINEKREFFDMISSGEIFALKQEKTKQGQIKEKRNKRKDSTFNKHL